MRIFSPSMHSRARFGVNSSSSVLPWSYYHHSQWPSMFGGGSLAVSSTALHRYRIILVANLRSPSGSAPDFPTPCPPWDVPILHCNGGGVTDVELVATQSAALLFVAMSGWCIGFLHVAFLLFSVRHVYPHRTGSSSLTSAGL